MAFCRVVFPLLVLSIVSCYASKHSIGNVPVYIMGKSVKTLTKSNPLSAMETDEFRGILDVELADVGMTIVFIEESLSVEDFSRKNDGVTSFPYLHQNLKDSAYLPAVQGPLHALYKIADPSVTAHITLTENGLSEEISPDRRFVFINLKDASDGESRVKLLHRHDKFILDTLAKLDPEDNVVAIYTAHYPSWTIPVSHSRVRRATEKNTRTLALDGLRLYAKSINIIDGNSSTSLANPTASSSAFTSTTMNTTMTFDNTSLVLNFYQKGGYWFFDTVTLNLPTISEELMANDEVFAILGFSYRCLQHVSFTGVNQTKTYTVAFEDLKIQPYFETNATSEFGDSFNCVGFFSAPIWAGLFVVFILLLITFYGIMMMLDIRTMDRFDDPKGKTITINAAE